jgi:sigma-B regulation protein RsbU (phosphoserine phosphatase)
MQRRILPPSLPAHPGVEFAAYYRTSRHAGGDYYDVLDRGGGGFGPIVSDVSGHGAPAAIVMAMIRAVLHTHPAPDDPAAVLRHLNRHFSYLWETAMFATAVYAVLDVGRRQLDIASAGHPPPLLLRQACRVAPLVLETAPALLFGEIDDVPCARIDLQSGDRLLFYTDGATDRCGADGTMYDGDRLVAALDRGRALAPAALVRHVVDDIDAFAGGHEPEDDQTLLLLSVR